MKYIHIRIIELLEEKGISKNRICKDLDLPRGNFKPSPKITKNHQNLLPWSLKSKIGTCAALLQIPDCRKLAKS